MCIIRFVEISWEFLDHRGVIDLLKEALALADPNIVDLGTTLLLESLAALGKVLFSESFWGMTKK
jgi:hypothetical protein